MVFCICVMEAKLEIPLLKFLQASPNPSFPSHRFCLKSWESKKKSFKNHFIGLSERWKFQVQEMSKGQHSTKQYLVHVVKEGETLTSISKQYGVSIYSIAAANMDIEDVDLVFKGQHLNIPATVGDTQMSKTKKGRLLIFHSPERHQSSWNALDGHINQKIFTVLSSYHLPHAKATGYFLVLVPLIAFCIRCIIGAFHNRVAVDLRHQAINESEAHHRGSRSIRWKSALRDIREPDNLDAGSKPDSNVGEFQTVVQNASDDQAQVPFEEASLAYTKLEHDYRKFLSECGMSDWGYWRGGASE